MPLCSERDAGTKPPAFTSNTCTSPSSITGVVLRENAPILELARHCGFVVDAEKPREPGALALVRALPRA